MLDIAEVIRVGPTSQTDGVVFLHSHYRLASSECHCFLLQLKHLLGEFINLLHGLSVLGLEGLGSLLRLLFELLVNLHFLLESRHTTIPIIILLFDPLELMFKIFALLGFRVQTLLSALIAMLHF